MAILKKAKKEGVSLRTIHGWLVILAIITCGLLIASTFYSFATFRHLSEATDDYIELQKAAYELMDASDYLTEMAQRFAASGDMEYLEGYFNEAFETRRREDAVEKMSEKPENADALAQLQEAMNGSVKLMEREYYSMRLVVEAYGYTDYPDVLREVELTPEHAALSAEEKKELAEDMVLGRDYYVEKDMIRTDMRESLEALENTTHATQTRSTSALETALVIMRIAIIIQTIGILAMIWLTTRLGINPVLKAVDRIRDDSPIPVTGANEIRYLARTYNQMYEAYKKSVERLNFKASHDELTQVYNRAGYDLLLSSLDMDKLYMLVFDVDNFKLVNDNYGHEIGDKVLKKVAETVRHNFRSDDYVCRLGGDEFVVLMVHAARNQTRLIQTKFTRINEELADTADGLPKVSVSVGASHGVNASDARELFTQADRALYESKRRGRCDFTFFTGEAGA